jgi:zeaxanthin glucosyltransferase
MTSSRHFAVLCPSLSGHLNPMMALCRELERRGHRITFYQLAHCRPKVEGAGFACRVFAEQDLSPQAIEQQTRELGELNGRRALLKTIGIFRKTVAGGLRDLPRMLREDRVDAALVDQVTIEGGTIAAEVGVPFVTVANAMILHREPAVPPFFTTWAYRDTWWGRLRNRLAWDALARFTAPVMRDLNDHRARLGLQEFHEVRDTLSPLAQVSQQPPEFEFPRRQRPACLHFCGPFIDTAVREAAPFPFERLDGRPIIYASMGTLQNRRLDVFHHIASACEGLPAQLVISLGGSASPAALSNLPGNPLTVQFAPQLELLKRAKLCVTHAGMNTVLECLAQGVPMVAIPMANDQPGVAARVRWSRAGEFVSPRRLNAARLRHVVRQVWSEEIYAESAQKMRHAIACSGGVRTAADVIEAALPSQDTYLVGRSQTRSHCGGGG